MAADGVPEVEAAFDQIQNGLNAVPTYGPLFGAIVELLRMMHRNATEHAEAINELGRRVEALEHRLLEAEISPRTE